MSEYERREAPYRWGQSAEELIEALQAAAEGLEDPVVEMDASERYGDTEITIQVAGSKAE